MGCGTCYCFADEASRLEVGANIKVHFFCKRLRARPHTIPNKAPIESEIQSLKSALRLKLGCMTSMKPPNALVLRNSGDSPMRPVRANGKARAANAKKCTNLSLPSGAIGGAVSGHSIAVVSTAANIIVIWMSKCFCMK